MQLQGPILEEICAAVRPGVNFLIFGAGRDTEFWVRQNARGRTVVLEDNPVWAAHCRRWTECVQVRYTTRQADALPLLEDEPKLREVHDALPAGIRSCRWDVILVDGPGGGPQDKRNPAFPGRMQSIYAAARLRNAATIVFVDDFHAEIGVSGGTTARVVELYTRRFLLGEPSGAWDLREIRYLHEGWLPNVAVRIEHTSRAGREPVAPSMLWAGSASRSGSTQAPGGVSLGSGHMVDRTEDVHAQGGESR